LARVLLENVTLEKGILCPVHSLTLEVRDKEFVSLLAPSGSGKTTTLRIVAGLDRPEKGSVWIGDEEVGDMTPAERDVAMIFQTYALYPHVSVRDNLASPLKVRKTPETEIDRSVKEVAEVLHIEDLLDKRPVTLSGGEMQRVAIGRALIRKPRVYLMDEPLTNLDAKLRVELRAEMKRLQKELGQTTIYATHDEVEALAMSNRIAVLNQGRLIQYDAPEAIYTHPKNTFVARFVGTPAMNMIPCSLEEKHGRKILQAGAFEYDITDFAEAVQGKATGDELVLGVRPAHVELHSKPPVDGGIQASVYVVEPMGRMTIVDVKVGENVFKVKVPHLFEGKPGDSVWISLDPRSVHIFDRKTGEAIA